MLSQRQRARLPAEVYDAIMSPVSNDARRTLHVVFKVVRNAPTQQQPKLWQHFEHKLSRELQPHVRELRAVCEKGWRE
jgi:hypothetical protein